MPLPATKMQYSMAMHLRGNGQSQAQQTLATVSLCDNICQPWLLTNRSADQWLGQT
jgi:hypothetical protein